MRVVHPSNHRGCVRRPKWWNPEVPFKCLSYLREDAVFAVVEGFVDYYKYLAVMEDMGGAPEGMQDSFWSLYKSELFRQTIRKMYSGHFAQKKEIRVLNRTVEEREADLEGTASDKSLLLRRLETFDQKYDSLKAELELRTSESARQVRDLARMSKKYEATKVKLASTAAELEKYKAYAGTLKVVNRRLEEDARDRRWRDIIGDRDSTRKGDGGDGVRPTPAAGARSGNRRVGRPASAKKTPAPSTSGAGTSSTSRKRSLDTSASAEATTSSKRPCIFPDRGCGQGTRPTGQVTPVVRTDRPARPRRDIIGLRVELDNLPPVPFSGRDTDPNLVRDGYAMPRRPGLQYPQDWR